MKYAVELGATADVYAFVTVEAANDDEAAEKALKEQIKPFEWQVSDVPSHTIYAVSCDPEE
jgi:hypothetical protein